MKWLFLTMLWCSGAVLSVKAILTRDPSGFPSDFLIGLAVMIVAQLIGEGMLGNL